VLLICCSFLSDFGVICRSVLTVMHLPCDSYYGRVCCGLLQKLHLHFVINDKYERHYWTRKGVHATVVTAGHCMHAELTSSSGHASASCYSS